MIDVGDFRELVVRPALGHLAPFASAMRSAAAENLLIGTALVETRLAAIRQQGIEPARAALGPFQMEPATCADLWDRYLARRPELRELVSATTVPGQPPTGQLAWNWLHAAAMARVLFWRVVEPLPAADDVEGLGAYWKRHWNTELGAGTVARFVLVYRRFAS